MSVFIKLLFIRGLLYRFRYLNSDFTIPWSDPGYIDFEISETRTRLRKFRDMLKEGGPQKKYKKIIK